MNNWKKQFDEWTTGKPWELDEDKFYIDASVGDIYDFIQQVERDAEGWKFFNSNWWRKAMLGTRQAEYDRGRRESVNDAYEKAAKEIIRFWDEDHDQGDGWTMEQGEAIAKAIRELKDE